MLFKPRDWIVFTLLALVGLGVWIRFTYPQIAFINLSVNRPQALTIAKAYLSENKKYDIRGYRHAAVFSGGRSMDQYLQKAIGFEKEVAFLREHQGDLFTWEVRFVRELEKEEFLVQVSAATGEVTGFVHTIPETETRPFVTEDDARLQLTAFLQKTFGFDPEAYTLQTNNARKMENRVDYSFTWEKNGVALPWSPEANSGVAKILIAGTVSGDEILQFKKFKFNIPDAFSRYVSKEAEVGGNLSLLFRIFFYVLLTSAVFFVIVRRNDLVLHSVKNFFLLLTGSIFLCHLAAFFNEFQSILYNYSTTKTMASHLWRHTVNMLMDSMIVTLGILMPALSGESLQYEMMPDKPRGGFLHLIRSSFFTRLMAKSILLGYLGAFGMIGLQALIFEIGQRYLGVWVEYTWLAQLSTGYFPFLAALILGLNASVTEEIAFRLFSINLGKKFLRNTALAVLVSSVIWGFGHSTYMVFPMWFRGMEVTVLGVYLSVIFLRYGIIPAIMTHYIFDVFWETSAYLLGRAAPFDFITSLMVFLLPAFLGAAAFILNRSDEPRSLYWRLNPHQIFNLEVLKTYLRTHPRVLNQSPAECKKEILSHGWDIAVVEKALKDQKESSLE